MEGLDILRNVKKLFKLHPSILIHPVYYAKYFHLRLEVNFVSVLSDFNKNH